MSDKDDWINEFIPQEQVEQIQAQASKIIKGQETFYEMSVMMTQDDMVEAVKAWNKMHTGNVESWMLGMAILGALIETMEYALERDNVELWDDE